MTQCLVALVSGLLITAGLDARLRDRLRSRFFVYSFSLVFCVL